MANPRGSGCFPPCRSFAENVSGINLIEARTSGKPAPKAYPGAGERWKEKARLNRVITYPLNTRKKDLFGSFLSRRNSQQVFNGLLAAIRDRTANFPTTIFYISRCLKFSNFRCLFLLIDRC